jgi:hypothetical protein
MAVTTFTTTASEDTRLAAAVQKAMGLGAPATGPQCKAFIATMIRQFVQQQEYITAQNLITSTPFDPT